MSTKKHAHNEHKWTTDEKIRIVKETSDLSEEEIDVYCRDLDLSPAELKRWRRQVREFLDTDAIDLIENI